MIYCVEDDNSIRDLMIYTLTIAGFEAKGFADSASFWKEQKAEVRPDDSSPSGHHGHRQRKRV